jgi:hypothetical protein
MKDETIKLKLTEEQIKILSSQAKAMSDGRLVIELFEEDNRIGSIKAASCAYYSDTCCAKQHGEE